MSISAGVMGALIGTLAFPQIAGDEPVVSAEVLAAAYFTGADIQSPYGSNTWGLHGHLRVVGEHLGKPVLEFPHNEIGSAWCSSTSAFQFGSGNWTLECWIKPKRAPGETGFPSDRILFSRWSEGLSTGRLFYLKTLNTNRMQFVYRTSSSSTVQTYSLPAISGFDWYDGKWHFVSVTRNGATIYFHVDGVQVGTLAAFTMYNASSVSAKAAFGMLEGASGGITYSRLMEVGEVRATRGSARYGAGSYAIPTAPFARNGDDPSWANVEMISSWENATGSPAAGQWYDNVSGGVFDWAVDLTESETSTQSVWYSDTLGLYSSASSTSVSYKVEAPVGRLDLGSQDFTFETWLSQNGSLSVTVIFGNFSLAFDNSTGVNTLTFSVGIGGVTRSITTSLPGTTPDHYALVRQGSELRLFKNGTSAGSTTVAGDVETPASRMFELISNGQYRKDLKAFRLVRGACLYPDGDAFTPPDPVEVLTPYAVEPTTVLAKESGTDYDLTGREAGVNYTITGEE